MDSQPDFILTQQPHENAIAIHILPLCDLLHRCLDVLNHIKPLVRLQKVKVETPSPTWDHPSGFNTHTCTLLILPHHLEGNVWSFFGDGIDKKIQGFITLPTWNLGVSVEKNQLVLGRTHLSFGHDWLPFRGHLVFCCCIFVWSLETNKKPSIKQLFAYAVKSPK